MSDSDASSRYRIDGFQQVIDLLNAADPSMRDRLMADLQARDPSLFKKIKERLVRFEDLVRLSPSSRRALFLANRRELWELALRKTDPKVIESLMSCLPMRTQEELKEAIALSTQRKLSEIEEAQRQIAERLRLGIDQGQYQFMDSKKE
jgi:flagellar motor switch protein FliG